MKKIIIICMAAVMICSCATTQPVPDTRPKNNYWQLSRQAVGLYNQNHPR